MKKTSFRFVLGLAGLWVEAQSLHAANQFAQNNLASDNTAVIPAATQVTNLVNPWGIAFSPTSPIWLANNGSGTSDLFTGAGFQIPLVASIPNETGTGSGNPTGMVFNSFGAAGSFNKDVFLFATEDGTIQGWRGGIPGNVSEILVDKSSIGSVFKGLAISNVNAATNTVYAADFHNDLILAHTAAGVETTFTDASIPTGFAPFNVQNLNGKLYVTFAKQDASGHDDVAGAGNGYIDVFNLDGTLDTGVNGTGRLVSNGPLNSPWGLAIAPTGFGSFGGDLLVGNFGNGNINAFNRSTGEYEGALEDAGGNDLKIQGLWGLAFGNHAAGPVITNNLYFTAGPHHEADGLFGDIVHTPDSGPGLPGLAAVFFGITIWARQRARKSAA